MFEEIFESSVRSAKDFAGVFECDGESSYFYLYDLRKDEGGKVIGAIRVTTSFPGVEQDDIVVCWSRCEEFVGLFVKGTLCAVFDARNRQNFGGHCSQGNLSAIPQLIAHAFGAAF